MIFSQIVRRGLSGPSQLRNVFTNRLAEGAPKRSALAHFLKQRLLWVVVVIVAASAIAPASTTEHGRLFIEGLKRAEAGKWREALTRFDLAYKSKPKEGGKVRDYGMQFKWYLPKFYSGLALYYLQDYDQALEHWGDSERQDAIQKSNEYRRLRELRQRYRFQILPEATSAARKRLTSVSATLEYAFQQVQLPSSQGDVRDAEVTLLQIKTSLEILERQLKAASDQGNYGQIRQVVHRLDDLSYRIEDQLHALGIEVSVPRLPEDDAAPISESVPLYGESHALLLGASRYKKEGWAQLPGVEADLKAVAVSLRRHGFQVVQVMNPSRDEFDKVVREFLDGPGSKPENRLVLYFAGHGDTVVTARQKNGYVVPVDAPQQRADMLGFLDKAISMEQFHLWARQSVAKHMLFVFDSCFAGTVFGIERGGERGVIAADRDGPIPDPIRRSAAKPVRMFIAAGRENQTVPDKSIFREYFVRALNGEANNNARFLTGGELGLYLFQRVTAASGGNQTPDYGKIKDQKYRGGDFVFDFGRTWTVTDVTSY